ncbi:mtcp1 [Ascosphaera apis ARSEF 7405]|uniref:Cx9C motif-containing protein 4, mitochondrial n=1 Tax=Ascosphaera apis ARSEF 7405 TaxID=392613 RepID=A0A168DQ34_9EURO|nr:mtcp1 [Ascosphaera apis ARSEF 7405]
MGLKEDIATDPPCHARACAIQNCLNKNGFQESKCQAQVDALYECCKAFYEAKGDDAKTVSCPKPDLLRLKMKQRAEGI